MSVTELKSVLQSTSKCFEDWKNLGISVVKFGRDYFEGHNTSVEQQTFSDKQTQGELLQLNDITIVC